MIILGVDPGTIITGYGVIEIFRGRLVVLDYDVIRNRNEHTMPVRLKTIYTRLCQVIERFHPDEFAIETAFYGKNAQSAMKLGHARGVSILAAVNHQIPTAEYAPREVKKAVAGNGAASKEQVSFMVRSLLKLKSAPKFYDATDALAVALCHYHASGKRSASKASTKGRGTSGSSWDSYIRAHPEKLVRPK